MSPFHAPVAARGHTRWYHTPEGKLGALRPVALGACSPAKRYSQAKGKLLGDTPLKRNFKLFLVYFFPSNSACGEHDADPAALPPARKRARARTQEAPERGRVKVVAPGLPSGRGTSVGVSSRARRSPTWRSIPA